MQKRYLRLELSEKRLGLEGSWFPVYLEVFVPDEFANDDVKMLHSLDARNMQLLTETDMKLIKEDK